MKWRTPAGWLVLLWLLWVVNKGAWEGYFAGDDLDSFAWMRWARPGTFLAGFLTPSFSATNFRPVTHALLTGLYHGAGYEFRWYVLAVQLLHLLNLGLLWGLLGRLGVAWAARWCGLGLFAFHVACLEAYWKPMFLYDVLCATFCLAALWAWVAGRPWWQPLLLFWCAYKSKELAIGLPVVLLAYEHWLGQRRYRALSPFFAVSVLFGLQALRVQGGREGDYGLRLTPLSLAQTMDYYASKILLLPHAGWALLAVPLLSRDKRVHWGLAAFVVLLAPMFVVPNRTLSAYLYLPLAGLAVALASVADQFSWRQVAPVLALWLGINYAQMRPVRSTLLFQAAEHRAYFTAVQELARQQPDLRRFLIDSYPPSLHWWGVTGCLRLAFGTNDLEAFAAEAHTTKDRPAADGSLALLSWDRPARRLDSLARLAGQPDASWIDMSGLTPLWQLESGWYGRDGAFRWTHPMAAARLHRPADAAAFEMRLNIGPDYIREIGAVTLETRLDGALLGRHTFTRQGWQTVRYPLASAPAGAVRVEFLVTPPFRPSNGDPRRLGIPMGAFGFR
ncbi:MAG: hypothetical protein NTX13_17180 [Acidobacteria bacterium]|jgi:hypothetical protein|nr:hypothetical protein [Acidobacteriota bacterium]